MSSIEIGVATARLLDSRVLRGCNVHHRSTVFSQRVDLGRFEGLRTPLAGANFVARFVDRFASLRPEFLAELNDTLGVPFERALLEAIRAVELAVAHTMRRLDTVDFATLVRDRGSPRVVELVWECHSGSLSRSAARAGLAGLLELMPPRLSGSDGEPGEEFALIFKKLQRRARRRRWSPTTAALGFEASKRDLPFEPVAGAHVRPGDGLLQRIASASLPDGTALQSIFLAGLSAGVPTALIVGRRGAGAVAKDLDGLLRAHGSAVGLATRALTTISGRPVDPESHGRGGGVRFLLADPRVETLVCAVSPRKVVQRGLRLDRATATAILDSKTAGGGGDGRRGIDVCISATTGPVVLSAGHALAGRLLDELPPERVVLLSRDPLAPLVIDHLSRGGGAVVRSARGSAKSVALRRFHDTVASIPVASLRSGGIRPSARRIRRAMLATALAFGLGLSGEEIAAAFERRRIRC